jgi:GDP-L-fucose synthase
VQLSREQPIYVAGHGGLVGSALMRLLRGEGFSNLITATREELDLRDSRLVEAFFQRTRPSIVILAAARVGGIQSNRTFPADFLYDNLMIQNNVIHQAHRFQAHRLVFLGSSCVYPRECPQPMKEEYLLTGPLEPTNEGYALAKIAGLRMAQYYERQYGLRCLCPMPCNLYGPNDSFDLQKSHVLSALVKRFVDAVDGGIDEITLWGSGVARREFLHVDDLARAVLFLLETYPRSDIINIGTGTDVSIQDLAEMISHQTGYTGRLLWDTSMPDGMPRKCMDVSKMHELGFQPSISLDDGIDQMIRDYRAVNALPHPAPLHSGSAA